jgi:hypothetical protein
VSGHQACFEFDTVYTTPGREHNLVVVVLETYDDGDGPLVAIYADRSGRRRQIPERMEERIRGELRGQISDEVVRWRDDQRVDNAGF